MFRKFNEWSVGRIKGGALWVLIAVMVMTKEDLWWLIY